MQTTPAAKPVSQSITINGVSYSQQDIAKAVHGAITIKPEEGSIVDDGDAVVLPGYKKIAVFKTEGKLKVVAKGEEASAVYALVNKHSLKKTHTAYQDVNTMYLDAPVHTRHSTQRTGNFNPPRFHRSQS